MAMRQVSDCGPHRAGRARAALFAGVSLVALAVAGGEARAQIVETWKAAPVDGDFNNGANWVSGTAPVSTRIAAFGASSLQTIDVTASAQPYAIRILSGAYVLGIANGVVLRLSVDGIDVQGGSATINNRAGGTLQLESSGYVSGAVISNEAGAIISMAGGAALLNTAVANTGVISLSQGANLFNSTITTSAGGSIALTGGASGGTSALSFTGNGKLDISGLGAFDPGTAIGSLASVSATSEVILGVKRLSVGATNTSTSFAGVISGAGGSLNKTGTGTLTLTGANSYTGATAVNGGTLIVNGSILSSSGVTVASGARIGGSGQLPSTTVNGTISPGNSPGTLTVNGNLVLGAGSVYLAEVQGAVADRINVTGTAALAGTLQLVPLGGAYQFSTPYTLLSAAGGRTGTFSPVETTGAFGDGVTASVAYTATDVQLTLTPKPLAPVIVDPAVAPAPPSSRLGLGRPANAHAVALGIDTAVANGADPSSLFAIYNLPAAAIPGAVNQLSGEIHTAVPAMAHSAAGQFLRSMLDGSGAGRLAGTMSGPGGATGFTADLPSRRDGPGHASLDPARFSLWGVTFGSTGRTVGDLAVGSANRNISDGHVAVGADIRLGSDTVVGAAVSGGQSHASLSGRLGKAEADVFQAGVYGRTFLGPVNLGAALGYARLDTDTNRAIAALTRTGVAASYVTQAWSGRIEASVPIATWGGFTVAPLAAFQAVQARSPAAVERDQTGATAGMLTLPGRSDVISRSELGLAFDATLMVGATPVSGFVRASWAHYYQRDTETTASINGLAGASFGVTGARPDRNAALLAAGADIKLSPSVSLGMRVDSEISANTRRIGGTARLNVHF